ncbi:MULTISPECIES: PH domain-containing protein [Rhodococcus]|uniref:PH domain-containing protein n=1 Tax=Rhodococcus oxybenzonivorans TaxID=1990687 RepID=A0AAE4V5V7_9NOCA|nr:MULTISPECIES: PH domain-containing protein [Rhodococcus]MDV7243548.1 PH domain-containing protein [Rhodococcus oxybenzonivorans]MDV7268937.1 PH domain-containing protein [Rhodococcus oxybenzonivorans]MDV7277524.1 PH domain-containing protein [Rhodococcus oxybenzonivorans]MDV7335448.1 PH domain-containing protein [Rhodococcus oxybenzonivorans]MDV7347236.1 PH domain-containing protein [Rhodococcus oxybenzonivorans]
MTEPIFDKSEQLKQVEQGILPGEQIIAVYDCIGAGTGFLGMTNLRVVIQDRSFVGKRTAITSIPYKYIRSISFLSNKSWAGQFFSSSSIALAVAGTTYEADFRGVDKAHHVHTVILGNIT